MMAGALSLELDLARNHFGPLTSAARTRILAALEHESVDTWDDVAGIIVSAAGGGVTLWQAVCAIDRTFPRAVTASANCDRPRPWPRTPSRQQLIDAMRFATH